MWVSHVVNPYNIVLMLQLLCVLPESMIHVRAHYVCEVGTEKDSMGILRWVLPYKNPCKCKSIRYGGHNSDTPKRPFHPVYVDKPHVGDDVEKIREHYSLDCIAPEIDTCSNVTTQTDQGSPTAVGVYEPPSTTDNSDDDVSMTCKPPPESEFKIGHTLVTCVAQDGSGNSASCKFDVHITDIEVPQFVGQCPANQENTAQLGKATAVVAYSPPNAIDNSNEVTVSCKPPPQAEFLIGHTPVICVAQDESGNTKTCNFDVHVKDEEEPQFDEPCLVNQENTVQPGKATAVVAYSLPNAIDNSNEVTVSCKPPPQAELSIGHTPVICVAQDESGNTKTCNFDVHVKERYCSTGWNITPEAKVNVWIDMTPGVHCSGELSHWTLFPKVATVLKAMILRVENGTFKVVGTNDITILPGHVNNLTRYQIPDDLQIQVRHGDYIGWAAQYGVLACGARLGFLRWFSMLESSVQQPNFNRQKYSDIEYFGCDIKATIQGTSGMCSIGGFVDAFNIQEGSWAFFAPDQYIPCNGVITDWTLIPQMAAAIKVLIWRHADYESGSVGTFDVVGTNMINISSEHINKSVTFSVPIADRIEVQAGDMIGWLSVVGFLAFDDQKYGAPVKWGYLTSSATSGTIYLLYGTSGSVNYQYAINATVVPTEATCDRGWKLFGMYCYQANSMPASFAYAESMCQEFGAHLTSIHSKGEQMFISDIFNTSINRIWIGLTDVSVDIDEDGFERPFVWTDNSQVDYVFWDQSQPDRRAFVNCVMADPPSGRWFDYRCDTQLQSMCKKSAILPS